MKLPYMKLILLDESCQAKNSEITILVDMNYAVWNSSCRLKLTC